MTRNPAAPSGSNVQEIAVSEEKLLPCPFCGGEPRVSTYQDESLWSHNIVTKTKVFCDNCDVGFDTEPGYELEAPEAWNRRAPALLQQESRT